MKDPVDHILRPSLPWRDESAITECGIDASKVKTLTMPEYFQRHKDLGRQRSAMLTCMTCSGTAERWGSWDDDPRHAMAREIAWERGEFFRARDGRGRRLLDELIAIETLIGRHREEFEAILTENTARREWLEKKAAHEAGKGGKPK